MIGETYVSRKRSRKRYEGSVVLKSECKWYMRVFKLLFTLTWCLAATLMITSIIKSTVGSLRPHFIDVCNPDVDCSNYSNDVYHLNYTCQANKSYETQKIINQARLSFPSGHSSFSAAVMGFNILYIQFRYKVFDFRVNGNKSPSNVSFGASTAYIKLFLQILSLGVACFISMSRLMDYYHHLVDVMVGFIIGAIIGILVGQQCIERVRKLEVISSLKTHEDPENGTGDETIQEMESFKECT